MVNRCPWAKNDLDIHYHDTKWGKPLHDEHELFVMLMLEGMQAGLSWSTILQKEAAMRQAFHNFDIDYLVNMTQDDVEGHMRNANILRNRLKINGLKKNALAYKFLCEKYGSLDHYLWSKIDDQPLVNEFQELSEIPTQTELSFEISQELKKMGFGFVGPVIIYAYMQAIGMVNDHLLSCDFR